MDDICVDLLFERLEGIELPPTEELVLQVPKKPSMYALSRHVTFLDILCTSPMSSRRF